MTYNLTCPSCGKQNKYSTKNGDIYQKEKTVHISWDCLNCKAEIGATYLYKRGHVKK